MQCPKCGHRRAKVGRCKFCKKINSGISHKKIAHSVIGMLKRRYTGMCFRSRKRGWPQPNISRDEFVKWYQNDTLVLQLFYAWRDTNFNKKKAPSVDRVDADLPYQRGNIQWTTWEDNWYKGHTVDHLSPETVQLSFDSAKGGGVLTEKISPGFTIKPPYSFIYGSFLCSKRQFEEMLKFDDKLQAAEFCEAKKYNNSMIREVSRLRPGKNGRTLLYSFGVMHQTAGFLSR